MEANDFSLGRVPHAVAKLAHGRGAVVAVRDAMGVGGAAERLLAGRWIAGPEARDALARTKRFNAVNIKTVINYLGEELADERAVADAERVYLSLIDMIRESGARADISMKPSQLGLRINPEEASARYGRIVARARDAGVFAWLDMERPEDVDATISMYEGNPGGTGICVQSYLRRSAADLERLCSGGAVVRLVKGAYSAGPDIAFQSRLETTKNYEMLMDYLFAHAREFVIATHDLDMINRARSLNRERGRHVWYAMLSGIRNRYAAALARENESVEIYVPFGPRWVDYSYRRLREASHLTLLIRSMASRQSI